MKTHKTLLFILTVILALGLAACGSGGGDATPEPAAPTAAASSADTQTADEPAAAPATKSPAPTAKPTLAAAPTDASAAQTDETLNLADRASGLKNLKSYRLTWISEWTPGDATQKPVQMKWTQETVTDPPAQYIAWSGTNTNPAAGAAAADEMVSQMWHIGPTTYMLMSANGESQCMAITQDEADTEAPFDPSLLGDIENAKYVGRETVNGMRTKHYVYDTIGFAMLGADKVKGDAWVAEDGNYMVKEVLTWEGGAGPFSGLAQDEAKGKGSWTWELSQINEKFTIEPPEECLNPAGDAALPMPPGAKSTMQTTQMAQYTLAMPVADVVKFYKNEMPAAGWSLEGDPTETDGLAMLAFTKDGKTANIMITGGDNNGSVVIVTVE